MGSVWTGLDPDRKYCVADAGIHPRAKYFANGTDRIISSDGINSWEMGLDEPPAKCVYKAKYNGSLDESANYYYKFVLRDSIRGIIGNPSPASDVMTTGTAGANEDGLTITIPTNSAIQSRVDEAEIYRTLGSGAVYFYEARVAYSGTAVDHNSTISDSALGSAISTDNGIPVARPYILNIGDNVILAGSISYDTGTVTTNGTTTIVGSGTGWTKAMIGKRFNVTADGSIFYLITAVASATSMTLNKAYAASDGSEKVYTISDNPLQWENSRVTDAGVILQESFPTDNWDTLQGGDGEKIKGLGRLGESTLLIFTNKSTWYSNKASVNAWAKSLKLHEGVGVADGAFMTIANDPITGDCFWFSNTLDVVRSSGSQLFNLSGPFIHNILNETHEGTHRNLRIDLSKIEDMHAIFYPARNWYMLFCTIPGETYPRMCLICNCDINGRVLPPPAEPGPSPWMLWILGVNATSSYLKPDSDGIDRPMITDEYGYRYLMDSGENDSVPSGTTTGLITHISSTVLRDSAAAFFTTGDGLKGVRVRTYDPDTWELENDIVIASNDADELTVAAWTTTPEVGDRYIVGGVSFDRFFKQESYGMPNKVKKRHNMYLTTDKASSARNLIVRNYVGGSKTEEFEGGQAIDVSSDTHHQISIGSRGKVHQNRLSNFYGGQPISIHDFTDEVTLKGKI